MGGVKCLGMQALMHRPIGFRMIAVLVLACAAGGCLPGQTSSPGLESDAGGPDSLTPVIACDPLAQIGCEVGEKCAQLVASVEPWLSSTSCVRAGEREIGETCERGADGPMGYDDCASGLSCLDGVCASICSTSPQDSCREASEAFGEGSYCTVFADLFSEATGLCVPGCDPADDNACEAGYGCYLNAERGVASCASVPPAATDLSQNSECYGPASGDCYLNGCAIGHTPLLANKTAGADGVVCARYCTPQESYQGNEAGIVGASSNCGAIALAQSGGTNGNAGEHQCRFVQSFYGNTDNLPAALGMCVPVLPLSGGSWGDCSAFDWDGIRERWDDAVLEGSDPVAAFRNHCLESPADPTNSPVFDRCIGLFRGCISLSEAEQVLEVPTGGAMLMSRRSWISTLGVGRPTMEGQVSWLWHAQN